MLENLLITENDMIDTLYCKLDKVLLPLLDCLKDEDKNDHLTIELPILATHIDSLIQKQNNIIERLELILNHLDI